MTNTIIPSLIAANKAAATLRNTADIKIHETLLFLSDRLEAESAEIIKANEIDLSKMDIADPRYDRLLLNEERIKKIASGIRNVAELADPSGKTILKRTLKNGLKLEKKSVPMGVIGTIYESRPNVTFDIAALCLRSKNGCILKGGHEAEESNKAAVELIQKVLEAHAIPPECVTLLPSDHQAVEELLGAQKYVDLLIPRGSAKLIEHVRNNSKIPIIETGAGVCHVYVHKEADLDKAVKIVTNAKVSRPSVCNAMDTILVDKQIAEKFLKKLSSVFEDFQIEIFADSNAYKILQNEKYPYLKKAELTDFGREFLSLKCSIKITSDFEEALQHIAMYSTRHSESIVSENKEICEIFLKEVDAGAVYCNASTRFTDGGIFGLGAEIGISTQKLHARGPFALEKLVTEKWIIRGNGQIR